MRANSFAFPIALVLLVAGLASPGCRTANTEPATPAEQATPGAAANPQEENARKAEGAAVSLEQRRQSLSQSYLDSAKANYEQGRLQEAYKDLAQVLELDPSNAEASSLFYRVGAMIGNREGAVGEAFSNARDRELVRIQEARFRADNLITQGRYQYEKGDYAGAIKSFEDALSIMEWFPHEIDTTADRAQVQAMLNDARQALEESRKENELRMAEEARTRRETEEETARTNVEHRKQELYDEADKQFRRGNYVVAEKLADEILRLDHQDERAAKLKDLSVQARHAGTSEQTRRDFAEQWKRAMEAVRGATVPQNELVQFPPNWDEISKRKPREFRPASASTTAEEQEILNRLSAIEVNPEFNETPLTQVAAFFQQVSGINFVVTKAVLDKLSEEERTVTFTVARLRLLNVLNIVTQIKGLTWKIEDGVVKITTPEDARSKVELEMLDVRDLVTPINDFPGEEITLKGSQQIEAEAETAAGGEVTAAIQADKLIQLIQENIAPGQWEAPAAIENKEGTLVIRQSHEVLAQIERLLGDLRKTTGLMVAIDSRFLTVEDNFLEDIGIDLRGLGDDSGGTGLAGRGNDNPIDDFGQPGAGFGTPNQPAVLGSGNDSGVFYSAGNDGDVRSRVENLFDTSLGSPDTLTSSGGTTVQYTFLDDVQIEAILRATRKSKRTNAVTAPRLLVANNERASMSVISEVSYIKDFDVEIAQAAVIADPIVDVVREGVILDVKPVISSDRKYVTLELRPTVSVLSRPIPTFSTTLGSGPPVAIQTPNLSVQRIRTTVTMPDRSWLLIGGLKISQERDVQSGVPFLDKIPFVSFLLGRKGTFNEKRNLLIILRSEIMILDEREPKFGSQTPVATGAR